MEKREALYASFASILSGLLLSYILHGPTNIPSIYSDIVSFWGAPGREWITNGQLPYVTEFFEYPPVSGLILYVARIVGGNEAGYYNAFSMMSLAAGGVLAWSCWSIAKKLGRRLNALYFLLPSIVVYGIYNFDLFHAMFIMLSLQALLYGRKTSSAVALGLAISTKLVSVVLIPVFLIEIVAFKQQQGDGEVRAVGWSPLPLRELPRRTVNFLRCEKDALSFLAVVVAVVAAFNLPFMIANFQSWLQTYTFLKGWGLEDAWFGWIFQSPACAVSASCAVWGYAKAFGFALMGVLLLRVYTLKIDVTTKTFLALTAYLLGTYIYAPQFNLILIPLVAVLAVDHPSLYLWDTFNALVILTWFAGWPSPNWHPTLPWTLPQEFALLRAVMLAWMAVWVLKRAGWNLRSLLPHLRQKTLDSAASQTQ